MANDFTNETVQWYFDNFGTLGLGDTVTILDTEAEIQRLTTGDFDAGFITHIDSGDDALSFSKEKLLSALDNGITFDSSDYLTLSDSEANLALLSTTELDDLVGAGVAAISPTGGAVHFRVDQFEHLGPMSVDGLATFTIADTGGNLSILTETQIDNMLSAGVDRIDSSTGSLTLTTATFNALGSIALTSTDTVTLSDDGATIASQADGFFSALAAKGIDVLEANDGALTLSFEKFDALGSVGLRPANIVTVTGTPSQLLSKSFAYYDTRKVDFLDADAPVTLTKAQAAALVATTNVHFAPGDNVTLADTALNIQALTNTQIGLLDDRGVGTIDVSGAGNITFTCAQFSALGTVTMAAGDHVTVSGTAGDLGTDFAAYDTANVETLHATDAVTLTEAQAQALAAADVVFDAASNVSVTVAGDSLAPLTTGDIAVLKAHGVDTLSAGGAWSLSVAEFNALNGLTLTGAGASTINVLQVDLTPENVTAWRDAGIDNISGTDLVVSSALYDDGTAFGAMVLSGGNDTLAVADDDDFDLLTITNAVASGFEHIFCAEQLSVTKAQLADLGTITLTGANNVLTGVTTADITAGNITAWDTAGITALTSGGVAFELTLAEFEQGRLAGMSLLASDPVTLTGVTTGDLTVTNIGYWTTAGINTITSDGAGLAVTAAGFDAIVSNGINFLGADPLTVTVTSDEVTQGTITNWIAQGVNTISAAGDLSITLDEYNGLATAGIAINVGGIFTLTEVGTTDVSFANINAWDLAGVDAISANGDLTISLSDYNTLVADGITVAAAGTFKLTGVTTGDVDASVAAWDAAGVDAISAGGALSMTVPVFQSLVTAGIALDAADDITLTGVATADITDPNIAAWLAADVDFITSDGGPTISMTSGQLLALTNGGVALIGADDVTVTVVSDDVTADNIADWIAQGVNTISAAGDLSISLAEYTSLTGASIAIDVAGTFTLTNVTSASITAGNITAWETAGVNAIAANGGAFDMTVAEFDALDAAGISLNLADTVTLTGVVTADITDGNITAWGLAGVDSLSAAGALELTITEFKALMAAGIHLRPLDTVTVTDVTNGDLTFDNLTDAMNEGVDTLAASGGAITMSAAQLGQILASGIALTEGDTVTVTVTSADVNATNIALWDTADVDAITAGGGSLSITKDEYTALMAAGIALNPADTVTMTGVTTADVDIGAIGAWDVAGIDGISAGGAIEITKAELDALVLADIALDPADTVTLTVANQGEFNGLDLGDMALAGIDNITCAGGLTVDLAKFNELVANTLAVSSGSDTLTLANQGEFNGLDFANVTAADIETIAGPGALALTAAQAAALCGSSAVLDSAIAVDLIDSGASIAALDGGDGAVFGLLESHGVDTINAADNAITLSSAQYLALGGVTINDGDTLTVQGTGAGNSITGRDGVDILYGNGGNDVLNGGNGNDTLDGGLGNDVLDGGAGIDLVSYAAASGGVNVDLTAGLATGAYGTDLLFNIERVTGSDFADTITGDTGSNELIGGGGNDTLAGDAADDTLEGGAGDDVLDGGTGTDAASYANATAGVTVSLMVSTAQAVGGGQGSDTLSGFENLIGSAYADSLTGNSKANVLRGGDGNDALIGGAGNDKLYGDSNNDTLEGGLGDDRLDGGTGTDLATYANATAGVTVNLTIAAAQAVGGGQGSDTLTSIEDLLGSAYGDTLTGNQKANVLRGGAGNDTLYGGDGNDRLIGGSGADKLTGNAGADTFVFSSAADSTDGTFDGIIDFDAAADKIDLWFSVTDIDAMVTGGTLSKATAGADLAAAIDASALGAHHAMLFKPTAGDQAGMKFLVIDCNNVAGYQAGADMVMRLTSPTHLSSLGVGTFT